MYKDSAYHELSSDLVFPRVVKTAAQQPQPSTRIAFSRQRRARERHGLGTKGRRGSERDTEAQIKSFASRRCHRAKAPPRLSIEKRKNLQAKNPPYTSDREKREDRGTRFLSSLEDAKEKHLQRLTHPTQSRRSSPSLGFRETPGRRPDRHSVVTKKTRRDCLVECLDTEGNKRGKKTSTVFPWTLLLRVLLPRETVHVYGEGTAIEGARGLPRPLTLE